jgi:hypothetical protein
MNIKNMNEAAKKIMNWSIDMQLEVEKNVDATVDIAEQNFIRRELNVPVRRLYRSIYYRGIREPIIDNVENT